MLLCRTLFPTAAAALTLAFAPDLRGQTSVPWTLERAIDHSLREHPSARVAAHRLAAAEAEVLRAAGARLPQLSLEGSYVQTNRPLNAFGMIINQGVFDFGIDFNDPGRVDNLNLNASVSLPLYTGGRIPGNRAAAEAGVAAQEKQREAVLAHLSMEVARSYFGIRQAQATVDALESAVEAVRESLRVASQRFDTGQVLKSELLNLEVQLAQSEEQLLAARHQRNLAARRFLLLLGLSPSGDVDLAENDPSLKRLVQPPTCKVDERPERQALIARIEAAEGQLAAARGQGKPEVGAFANYNYDQGFELDGDGNHWMAGVRVTWNVFDGNTARADILKAQASLDEARASLEEMDLNLAFALEQARLGLQLAQAQVEVTENLVEQAEESAAISRQQFAVGKLLSTELIGAETRLAQARMQRAVALANERVATAQLRRTCGMPVLP